MLFSGRTPSRTICSNAPSVTVEAIHNSSGVGASTEDISKGCGSESGAKEAAMKAGTLGPAAAQGKTSADGAAAAVSLRDHGGGAGDLAGTATEGKKAEK